MTMNPEVKARWVADLRSGKYQQGKGYLALTSTRTGAITNACCLGVLCEIAVEDQVVTRTAYPTEAVPDRIVYEDKVGGGTSDILLPLDVIIWAGLDQGSDPLVPVRPESFPHLDWAKIKDENFLDDVPDGVYPVRLSTLNDHGVTFDQIADLIEEHL